MSKFSPCGERFQVQHGYTLDDRTKSRVFGKVGEVNVREKIKTSGIGTSLYEMIDRYQKTGDDSFLFVKNKAMDADLTNLPKNLIEVYNLKSTCVEDFKKFPVEYRALFNHNVDDYIKSIQDNSIEKITNDYLASKGQLTDVQTNSEGGDSNG